MDGGIRAWKLGGDAGTDIVIFRTSSPCDDARVTMYRIGFHIVIRQDII